MAKGFSKNNPLSNLTNTSVPKSTISASTVAHDLDPKQKQPTVKQKRKVGRPATKDVKNTCKNINIAVPVDLLNKWEEVKIVHGSNLTEYITRLIEKDMDANYERYKEITNSLKDI